MDYKWEYNRWLEHTNGDIQEELQNMSDTQIEDAFYRNLSFGTGGLRGIIGAGTNRINVYVVAKASQGLSDYLLEKYTSPSVVIGYDSRIKSDIFAQTAAGVFAANGIAVYFWPKLMPVPTVSFAIRYLSASAGVMITASHNPCRYNGYKVYGHDGCQITTEAATEILAQIDKLDIFSDVKYLSFSEAVLNSKVKYIDNVVLDEFLSAVRLQSVIYGDMINRNVAIVYSPLNGTGLIPVTHVLREAGFSNITIVREQQEPDGNFTTCPYPNPEIREAMNVGLEYCELVNADLLIATDPDCDRCGIAVKGDTGDYRLLTGNEVGLLLLDFICAQRMIHHQMPDDPVFVKTIVTTDLAEKIAARYGVRTINVLTGFKFVGEIIGRLENKQNFIFGFEESYGYLTGTYVRDKDAVNAALMIAEMFAYYKTRGVSLLEKLNELYSSYGYCLNSLNTYDFPGSTGMKQMEEIMEHFRKGIKGFGREKIINVEDYLSGINDLPSSNVLKFFIPSGTIVIRPSGTEPKMKVYISITAKDQYSAQKKECMIRADIESCLR